jgi:RNA polymerase sigma factor (sigma-70 family)
MQTTDVRQTRIGLLARRSPLLRLQSDERLIALIRSGNEGAFEHLFERYRSRLLGFCRHMLGSKEDAEDVLQEVFVASYNAIRADAREINVRPWLYRIARNRCLNHLRRPTQDGRDTMDDQIHANGISTADLVHRRADFRHLLQDIQKLPETQRTALLLREMDALSYEQIADAMDTTVPSVKSLLVRARIGLAEAAEARRLSCTDVRLELAEIAEGLKKTTPPIRRHLRECEQCGEFRTQLRKTSTAMAIALPLGPVMIFKKLVAAKLGIAAAGGGAAAGGAGGAAGAGGGVAAAGGAAAGGAAATGAGAGAVAATGAAAGGIAGGGGLAAGGAVGIGAVATKAVAVTAATALLAGGAVEMRKAVQPEPVKSAPAVVQKKQEPAFDSGGQAVATLPPVAETKKKLEASAEDAQATEATKAGATGDTGSPDATDPVTTTVPSQAETGPSGPAGTSDGAGPVDANGVPESAPPATDTGGATLPAAQAPRSSDGDSAPSPSTQAAPQP